MGLQGTLDTFSLAEVLGLVERARQTGGLEVRGPEGHGTVYVTAGRFSAGEAADYSGPVETREALDVRLVDVCFHLFRFGAGSFEFVPGRMPPWPAERATDIGPIVERVARIVHDWPAVEAVVPSFELRPIVADDLPDESVTLSRSGFRVLALSDGIRTVRQVARESGRSVVEIAAALAELVEQGAVAFASDAAPTRPAEPGPVLPTGALHAVRETAGGEGGAPVEMVTSVPDPSASLDRAALERERAVLAAKAGLHDPGPMPEEDADEEEEEDANRSTITSDRGALLRLFSGLRDQG